jgi:transposase-like protein
MQLALLVKMSMQNREEVQQRMFDLIDQWKKSGQTQKAFCLQHEARYSVFHYWYKQYREAHNTSTDTASSFTRLQINPIPMGSCLPTASNAELIYPDGRRLLFHQPVDVNFLKRLLG